MRRICGIPVSKIFYIDVVLCLVGLAYITVQGVIVYNGSGYNVTHGYLVYGLALPLWVCIFVGLMSHIFLRRGIREKRKVYIQIHFAIRLSVKLIFHSVCLYFLVTSYLPSKNITLNHKVVQISKLAVVFFMGCLHLWVVNIYMDEVLPHSIKAEGDTGNVEDIGFRLLDKPSCKFLKSITLPEKKVNIKLATVLGVGQFCKVVEGKYSGKTVAIKVSDKGYPDFKNNLLAELKILSVVKLHPNIVKFYGVTFLHTYCGIVLERCRCSLQSYLVKLDAKSLDKKEFRRISAQVVSGMDFLGSKNIVHGDLAARNVLLGEHNAAKISDFGLSLKLYYYQLYATSGHSIFPWRWMPPEALVDLKFSVQSDVWSFGVLLWEIFSLGKIPYDHVNWSSDFAQLLKAGLRLGRPDFADNQLFEIMKSCWQFEPTDRISFKEILLHLGQTKG